MSPIKACVALITLLAAAGVASGQEVADEAPVAATPAAAPASSNDASAAADAAAPVKVVNAAELIAREPPRVICREMLRGWSNVHVLQCMTAEHWKIWERAEAREAASTVRMLQGNPFR